jgi:metal-sulfur cluster biosynthetic enzyme
MTDATTPLPEAAALPASEEQVRRALSTVYDPEVGHSITALGLIDRIDLQPGRLHVTLVPTSATCPMADLILEHAESALRAVCAPNTEMSVEMDWNQTWTPERMDEDLRRSFGW